MIIACLYAHIDAPLTRSTPQPSVFGNAETQLLMVVAMICSGVWFAGLARATSKAAWVRRARPVFRVWLHPAGWTGGRKEGRRRSDGAARHEPRLVRRHARSSLPQRTLLITAQDPCDQLLEERISEQPDQPGPKIIRHKHHASNLPRSAVHREDFGASESAVASVP